MVTKFEDLKGLSEGLFLTSSRVKLMRNWRWSQSTLPSDIGLINTFREPSSHLLMSTTM